jgi:hypothetical protein
MTKQISIAAVCAALIAAPAAADVTLKQKHGGKGMGASMAGEGVQYIKGTKMRTDQTMGGKKITVIIDAAAQRMITIDHDRKEATITDMRAITKDLAKIDASDVKASITPTSQKRQIAGASCTVHNMDVRVPAKIGQGDDVLVTMSGPVCLVKGGPGAADYAAFYQAAAEKGLFFTDPRAAKAQPGQAKGMTELYRQMSAAGVAYATELSFKFEGSGMMAQMMNKVGAMTMTSEVTEISAAPLADALFEVPAGYKTKTQ